MARTKLKFSTFFFGGVRNAMENNKEKKELHKGCCSRLLLHNGKLTFKN